jgi:hypothetical protein
MNDPQTSESKPRNNYERAREESLSRSFERQLASVRPEQHRTPKRRSTTFDHRFRR